MTSKLKLIWLVPILITIHNLEEAVFMPAALARRNAAIPNPLHGLLPAITYRQFLLALLIMTSIPYLIAWFAAREGERLGAGMFWLLCVQAMMLVNVFAHAGMAFLVAGYAPGLVTAIVINLPFSIYLLTHAVQERWVTARTMVLVVAIGLLLHAIVLPLIIILSGSVANNV